MLAISWARSQSKKDILASILNSSSDILITIKINKIYNINAKEETYCIDGYIMYSWFSTDFITQLKPKVASLPSNIIPLEEVVPLFEMVNIQGPKESTTIKLEVQDNGWLNYKERFFGTFHTDMNFIKFPFDNQTYSILLEPFSLNELKATNCHFQLIAEDDHNEFLGEDWRFINHNILQTYLCNTYKWVLKRVAFEIQSSRIPSYYIWQILLPLLMLTLATFTIFWMRSFEVQMGVGFTLMLTVVAFNFYTGSILPELPYNTFLHYVILIGYVYTFLAIIAAIVVHQVKTDKTIFILNRVFKFGFLTLYIITILLLYQNVIIKI